MIEQTSTQTRRELRMAAEADARRTAKARAAKTGRKVGVVLGTSGLLLTTSVAAMADGDSQSEGRGQATLAVEQAGGTELAAHASPAAVTASSDVELAFDRPAVTTEGSPAVEETSVESAEATTAETTSETSAQPSTGAVESAEASQPAEAPAAATTEASQAASSTVEAEPAPAANSSVISAAYSAIGTPYLWAGSTLGGMDCSGFINWAYAQAGQPLPGGARSTHGMLASFPRVSSPQPGDIVVVSGIRSQYHAGIYVGNGQMIGALAASGVTTHGYNDSWHNVIAILRPS